MFQEAVAGHFFWRGQTEQFQERRGDVGEDTIFQTIFPGVRGDIDEMDEVGGVGGVRGTVRVAHQLAIAVIGRHQSLTASGQKGFQDLVHALVDGFHRFDAGGYHAGVADHVGIGKVQDDQIVVLQSIDHLRGHFRGTHLGHQIIGRHLRRWDNDPVLASEGYFHAAIEKVGDVRIFFGFGNSQLFLARRTDYFSEDFIQGSAVGRQPGN